MFCLYEIGCPHRTKIQLRVSKTYTCFIHFEPIRVVIFLFIWEFLVQQSTFLPELNSSPSVQKTFSYFSANHLWFFIEMKNSCTANSSLRISIFPLQCLAFVFILGWKKANYFFHNLETTTDSFEYKLFKLFIRTNQTAVVYAALTLINSGSLRQPKTRMLWEICVALKQNVYEKFP